MVLLATWTRGLEHGVLSALDFSPYGLNHEAATQEVPYNHEYHMALILIK